MRFLLPLLLPLGLYAQAAGPVKISIPIPPVPIVTSDTITPEPSQFFSVGGGVSGLGPTQAFGYYSMSQRIAPGTFTTEITELVRMKGGAVGTSARAGVSKLLWVIGPMSIGIVGDAGAAEGTTGSASGAFSARTFITTKIGTSPWYVVGTAESTKIAGTGQQSVITLGIGFAIK